jgi:CelD/BcsL family acetyltransferase involved in cellulose biosynthesis
VEREIVDTLSAFDALRPEWDELRRADRNATVFLSSPWLRAFLSMTPTPWSILTLRHSGRLVGALPISLRNAPHRLVPIAREITFASEPFADYQGILCAPQHEAAVIEAFASMVHALRWDRARFPDVQDERFAAIVERLAANGTAVERAPATPCSIIDLPDDWHTYLATLSKPTRRSTLRPLKQLAEELPELRHSEATPETADAHIAAILDLSALRWGSTPARRRKYEALFRAAFDQDCLRIAILWDGQRPFAGGAAFVDAERGVFGAYQVGHDPAYSRFSPGKALLGGQIRDAIERGYRVFDFMRGDESYKSSYSTREISNVHYSLRRAGARGTLLRLAEPAYAALRSAYARRRLRGGLGT